MRTTMLAGAALTLALTAGGCHSNARHGPAHDRNLITADEILHANANTAYEAVERLRPAFLVTRGASSIQDPTPPSPIIYLDGVRYGPVSSMTSIPAMEIATIQYLPPIEAAMRYGLGHEGGAILILTKR